MKLKRFSGNPILKPKPNNKWENFSVCNPGACLYNGKISLLYRASGNEKEHKIHFGLAISDDGYKFKRVSNKPVLSPSKDGADGGCIEDPRIVNFGDYYFITYAYRPFPPGQYWLNSYGEVDKPGDSPNAPINIRENLTQTGLLMTKNFHSFKRLGRISPATLNSRNMTLFPEKIRGKYFLLHRFNEWVGKKYGCQHPSIWICSSDDLFRWSGDKLLAKGESDWEKKIGAGPPPIKTESGWLVIYHGVSDDLVYRTGVILLDLNNPYRVIARSPDFIMEPEEEYETKGVFKNCVFVTGAVVINDTLFIYYGGADKYCCLATCKLSELIKYVLKFPVK